MDPETLRTPVYTPEGSAIVRHNGDRFNNRPLYCNQTSAIVVARDRPLIRFGNGSVLNGSFMAALVRGNKAKWLHDWSDITSKYRPDRMEWTLKDGGFASTVVTLDAVPPLNFWSLCPFGRADYDYKRDGFCLPKVPPATVQLGANCRAILLNRRLRPDAALESVTLETLSQEVIIGLMGASLMNPR